MARPRLCVRVPQLGIVLAALALAPAAAAAAPAPPDTLAEAQGWAREVVATLSVSQAAYSHWQEGGVNALAVTANTRGRFARVIGGFRQRHDARLGFGVIRQDTLDLRKAVDVIRYGFQLQLEIDGPWRPSFATEIRTQFAPGFDYDPTPDRYPALADVIVPGERLKVSDLFAPAHWTQSLGVAYEPAAWFSARSGLGLKQTIVLIERLRPVYGNRLGQPLRLQAGIDALFEARGEVLQNVHVQSRLAVFQAFTDFAEATPDLLWETVAVLRVNRWLSVNGEFAALYDRDVLDRVQLKQVLALGVSVIVL